MTIEKCYTCHHYRVTEDLRNRLAAALMVIQDKEAEIESLRALIRGDKK